MVGWLDRLQRRSRVAGFFIAVIYKYVDDQGSYLAALVTYYAFVSLFPALLPSTTVLGVVWWATQGCRSSYTSALGVPPPPKTIGSLTFRVVDLTLRGDSDD